MQGRFSHLFSNTSVLLLLVSSFDFIVSFGPIKLLNYIQELYSYFYDEICSNRGGMIKKHCNNAENRSYLIYSNVLLKFVCDYPIDLSKLLSFEEEPIPLMMNDIQFE